MNLSDFISNPVSFECNTYIAMLLLRVGHLRVRALGKLQITSFVANSVDAYPDRGRVPPDMSRFLYLALYGQRHL